MDRAQIAHWLTDRQYHWIDRLGGRGEKLSDALYAVQYWVIERPAKWVLCVHLGHEPIQDQCGRPEHDHCVWCRRPMPGQASRQ